MEIRSDTSSPGVGSETRWSASKEEILEEMVAKSTEIDFLKSDKKDSSVSSKDQLRARVYSLLREVAHVPLSSPPRLKKSNSFFETSCGLVQEKPNTFGSFPESNHASSALQLMNNSLWK
jgi:hypothetical protein